MSTTAHTDGSWRIPLLRFAMAGAVSAAGVLSPVENELETITQTARTEAPDVLASENFRYLPILVSAGTQLIPGLEDSILASKSQIISLAQQELMDSAEGEISSSLAGLIARLYDRFGDQAGAELLRETERLENPPVTWALIRHLGFLGSVAAKPRLELLEKILDSQSPGMRTASIIALGNFGDAKADEALERRLTKETNSVARAMLVAYLNKDEHDARAKSPASVA